MPRPGPVLLIVGQSPVSLDPGSRSRVYFPGMITETRALTTGALAQRAHVPLDTVRYCERRGRLPEPPWTAAGYRQYPEDTVRWVTFIKRAQAVGFTLEELAELLALRMTSGDGCQTVERQARVVRSAGSTGRSPSCPECAALSADWPLAVTANTCRTSARCSPPWTHNH